MSGVITLPAGDAMEEEYFDLRRALRALDRGTPVTFPPMQMTRVRIGDRDLAFFTNCVKNPVPRMLRKGRFYEGDELRDVAKILPEGARVLDVGANLGNHALFFATQAGAAQVLANEPNPLALALFLANVVMTELRGVIRTEALGIGLGRVRRAGF